MVAPAAVEVVVVVVVGAGASLVAAVPSIVVGPVENFGQGVADLAAWSVAALVVLDHHHAAWN